MLNLEELIKEYNKYQDMHLSIDLSRGKPCKEQLDLSNGMMDVLNSSSDFCSLDGVDVRNYGVLGGIKECKELVSSIIDVPEDNIIIYGNSSLYVMFEQISRSMTHGVMGYTPWCKLDKIKWLCPVPGYDRHFSITEYFGIEMINIPMNNDGPDMDLIEELVKDPCVKGIWCVPKYSNPTGITYSDSVVSRFARLKPASPDFRIYWDDAYSCHHLYPDKMDHLLDIFSECEKAGNPDLVYIFLSTSKITFPGSGISAIASSKNNLTDIMKYMQINTIGYDKVNELRHVRFFKDINGIKDIMDKHANIIRPKFELVLKILDEELKDFKDIYWSHPHGGYFISLEVNGIAKEVEARCKECGVKLTPYGSSFPYHIDKNNSNIRIAPTCLSLDDLSLAMKILCLSIKIESIINDKK